MKINVCQVKMSDVYDTLGEDSRCFSTQSNGDVWFAPDSLIGADVYEWEKYLDNNPEVIEYYEWRTVTNEPADRDADCIALGDDDWYFV